MASAHTIQMQILSLSASDSQTMLLVISKPSQFVLIIPFTLPSTALSHFVTVTSVSLLTSCTLVPFPFVPPL